MFRFSSAVAPHFTSLGGCAIKPAPMTFYPFEINYCKTVTNMLQFSYFLDYIRFFDLSFLLFSRPCVRAASFLTEVCYGFDFC